MTRSKKRIVAAILLIALALAIPAYADTARASGQLSRYSVNAENIGGHIYVHVNVFGTLNVTKVGCESIYVYEKVGSDWQLYEKLLEDDPEMSVSSSMYLHTHDFDSRAGKEYKVNVTIFAENADGRDTRDFTFIV